MSEATIASLEGLLTSVAGFGLVTATPLQRAICRLAEGLPLGELGEHPDVLAAIGRIEFVGRCAQLYIVSGIRTGKSLFTGALAIHSSQICDVSPLGPGEIPRVSVISLDLDKAAVVLRDHIVGRTQASEALKALLLEDPKRDSVLFRHPTGRGVEIKTVAGTRAGGSLVARWSAGAIFDEAPRMVGDDDAVVTFGEGRRAVLGRLLPGASLVAVGSAGPPRGELYDDVMAHWGGIHPERATSLSDPMHEPIREVVAKWQPLGKPTKALVVVRAPAPLLNPIQWTPERCEALRLMDDAAWRTDVCAEFIEQGLTLFSSREIDAATRRASV